MKTARRLIIPEPRPEFGVFLDEIYISDGILVLCPYDKGRDHLDFTLITLDFMPRDEKGQPRAGYQTHQGIKEEWPIDFSNLDDAIGNAVYRATVILDVHKDDLPDLADKIRSLIADHYPDLLTPAEPVFHRHYNNGGVALTA